MKLVASDKYSAYSSLIWTVIIFMLLGGCALTQVSLVMEIDRNADNSRSLDDCMKELNDLSCEELDECEEYCGILTNGAFRDSSKARQMCYDSIHEAQREICV